MRLLCCVLLLVASPALAQTFEVSLTASAVDAQAFIDDDAPLPMPVTLRREAGVLHVRISAPGYRPYEADVEVG